MATDDAEPQDDTVTQDRAALPSNTKWQRLGSGLSLFEYRTHGQAGAQRTRLGSFEQFWGWVQVIQAVHFILLKEGDKPEFSAKDEAKRLKIADTAWKHCAHLYDRLDEIVRFGEEMAMSDRFEFGKGTKIGTYPTLNAIHNKFYKDETAPPTNRRSVKEVTEELFDTQDKLTEVENKLANAELLVEIAEGAERKIRQEREQLRQEREQLRTELETALKTVTEQAAKIARLEAEIVALRHPAGVNNNHNDDPEPDPPAAAPIPPAAEPDSRESVGGTIGEIGDGLPDDDVGFLNSTYKLREFVDPFVIRARAAFFSDLVFMASMTDSEESWFAQQSELWWATHRGRTRKQIKAIAFPADDQPSPSDPSRANARRDERAILPIG